MIKNSLKVNLHTHTTYCDGTNTAEEMILSAIENGFDVLGFSGHSYTPFDESYCMSLENTKRYVKEVRNLAKKYKDQITVLCGIEQDIYSNQTTDPYDYVIGSVHAFYKEYEGIGHYIYVDYDSDTIKEASANFYQGDYLALAEDYFATLSDVTKITQCQIVGHFDLLTKFNEQNFMFEEDHPRYEAAVDKALSKLLVSNPIFEINTGAMSKGYRTTPYPASSILRKIYRAGGRITINSDSHSASTLDYAFEEAVEAAYSCGFRTFWTMNQEGKFIEQPL